MTEEDWLTCEDPRPMLAFLGEQGNERKVRLFTCACCRRICGLVSDERIHGAIDVAERFADGFATDNEMRGAYRSAHAGAYRVLLETEADETFWGDDGPGVFFATAFNHPIRFSASFYAATAVSESCSADPHRFADQACDAAQYARDPNYNSHQGPSEAEGERKVQATLLRDVFGNPFRPRTARAAWCQPTTLRLARAAYEERVLPSGELDAARLAVLSDALEEAGCTDVTILDHLRSPGPHVRGCWLIDLLLARN